MPPFQETSFEPQHPWPCLLGGSCLTKGLSSLPHPSSADRPLRWFKERQEPLRMHSEAEPRNEWEPLGNAFRATRTSERTRGLNIL